MANRIRREVRQWRHDLSEIAVDSLTGLAQRISGIPVHTRDYSNIGPSEMAGTDSLVVEGEDQLAGGQLKVAYEAHLFTNSCVNYIANKRAGVPLRFYTTQMVNGEPVLTPADDHPVARAFSWFNPHMSSYEAWEWLESWMLLAGKGTMAIETPGPDTPAGIPFELWPLYPNGLTPIRSPRDGLSGYQYQIEGRARTFLPEEIVEFREFSTLRRFTGMGRLYAGRGEILTDLRARKWNDELLKHGVHIAGTLETDESITPDGAKAIKRTFNKQYGGADSAGRVAVLWDGLKFQPHTLAHKDIAFVEQLNMTKEDIAMAFGLPLELLGQKSANFASLQEKRRIFWQDVMVARGQRVEAVMNDTVLPQLAPELTVRYDYSGVDAMQADQNALVKTANEAVAGSLMTINEARKGVLSLEDIDGGDVLMIGRGLQPLEAALADAASEGSDDASRALPPREGQVARALKSMQGNTGVVKAADPVLAEIAKLHDQTELRVQNILNEQFRQIELNLGPHVTDPHLVKAEEVILVDGRKAIIARSEPALRKAAEIAGGIVSQAIGVTGSLDLRNTAAEVVLRSHAKHIKGVTLRSWDTLKTSLVEGLAQGESEKTLKARVSHHFRNARSNSLTIARTETAQAINSASLSTMTEARRLHGINVQAEWNTVIDGVTRDGQPAGEADHISAHGLKITPGDELFEVSGERLRFPGDTENGSLENTINCRCSLRPVLEAS